MTRQLRLGDAVAIGVGSMVGAGVFSVWGPASQAAGSLLLVAVVIAAVVAFCNATSSAQLAAQFPVSGGSYIYGRELLGPWSGYAAGWCFVIGKTASCAAMALTLAAYVVPGDGRSLAGRAVAVAAVIALTAVNCMGVTRTAALTKSIVAVVVTVLAGVAVAVMVSRTTSPALIQPLPQPGVFTVAQAAALIFFAFAGYARIATMGEEVVRPERTIPRAIIGSLAAAVVIYLAIAALVVTRLGGAVIGSSQPLADLARTSGQRWLLVPIGVAAAAATAGALLNLMTGIGRTTLAMSRHRDLPGWLSALHPSTGVPYRAEICLGVVVCLLVLTIDLRSAISGSSFGVLLYYAVANLSALRQQPSWRGWPRLLPLLGVVGCLALVATLPLRVILAGVAVLVVGVMVRLVNTRRELPVN